ncbi:MAG: hypothetical protein K2G38_02670 [Clostridia bacterium]|nr:hypothetical protein [Clostridia bacterium]
MSKANGKRLTGRKKLIISLSAVFGALIILGAILLGLFCPRGISAYCNVKADKVDRVYYAYHDWESGSDGRIEIDLPAEKVSTFIKKIKKVKVVPDYIPCKCEDFNSFFIVSGDTVYEIDSLGITVYKNGKWYKHNSYNTVDNSLWELTKLFGIE